jgi:hypothetical protein
MLAARAWMLRAALAASLAISGCLSPTLPLPPPDPPAVTAIDTEGNVTLHGTPGSVDAGSLVNAFNQNTGHGVIERADGVGAYTIVIGASVGDTIALWQEVGNETSSPTLVTIKPQDKAAK